MTGTTRATDPAASTTSKARPIGGEPDGEDRTRPRALATEAGSRGLSWSELEVLLQLQPGETVGIAHKKTGRRSQGTVDTVAPGLGKLWIRAELDERRLIDVQEWDISRAGGS